MCHPARPNSRPRRCPPGISRVARHCRPHISHDVSKRAVLQVVRDHMARWRCTQDLVCVTPAWRAWRTCSERPGQHVEACQVVGVGPARGSSTMRRVFASRWGRRATTLVATHCRLTGHRLCSLPVLLLSAFERGPVVHEALIARVRCLQLRRRAGYAVVGSRAGVGRTTEVLSCRTRAGFLTKIAQLHRPKDASGRVMTATWVAST
jgi:hypothetical protein